jgi:hypothetical protein
MRHVAHFHSKDVRHEDTLPIPRPIDCEHRWSDEKSLLLRRNYLAGTLLRDT